MSGKKLSSSFIAFLVLLFSANAFATLTYTSAAGVSGVDLTTVTTPIIYAGFAGTCDAGVSTCNSCKGTGLFPCNLNNVTTSSNLVLTFTTDNTTATTAPVLHITTSTGATIGTATNWTVGATTLTMTVLWSDLCGAATGTDATCKTSITNDLYMTYGSDTMTLKIVTRYQDATVASNYIDCPDAGVDPNSGTANPNVGFCHFKRFPGDGKIYADDIAGSASFPSSPNTSSKYTNAVFFYEAQLPTDADDLATIARITNNSPSKLLPLNTTTNDLSDTRVTGLSNGTRYCMVMASQDATGVIAFFSPTPTLAGANDFYCTSPEPVVGLLDDKHCFIATAAFGSEMAPEVQSFRDFRNKYLLPFSWGQKFVKTYYKYSPQYAEMIASNETAKTIVRAALWPLLFFARMSVAFGFWTSLIMMAAAVLLAMEACRRLTLRRTVRGEL